MSNNLASRLTLPATGKAFSDYIVVSDINTIDSEQVNPNKLYWIKGTPDQSNKNLLIVSKQNKNSTTYNLSVIPYSNVPDWKDFELTMSLASGKYSLRNYMHVGANIEQLSDLNYLAEMKDLDHQIAKPKDWKISDETYRIFQAIATSFEDKDYNNADIVYVPEGIDRKNAETFLLNNYLANHFTQQLTNSSKSLNS